MRQRHPPKTPPIHPFQHQHRSRKPPLLPIHLNPNIHPNTTLPHLPLHKPLHLLPPIHSLQHPRTPQKILPTTHTPPPTTPSPPILNNPPKPLTNLTHIYTNHSTNPHPKHQTPTNPPNREGHTPQKNPAIPIGNLPKPPHIKIMGFTLIRYTVARRVLGSPHRDNPEETKLTSRKNGRSIHSLRNLGGSYAHLVVGCGLGGV